MIQRPSFPDLQAMPRNQIEPPSYLPLKNFGILIDKIDRRTTPCVTVAVDNMYFKAGAKVNDTIVLIGRLTHVGRSSMEVRIDTYCEALDGTRTMINRAYFTMVGTALL